MRWERNLVQQEGEMVDSAMGEKLGTTGRRDGGQCEGRETWYNRKERRWTVRWEINLVQLEGETVDSSMGEKLGRTGKRGGGQCDGRETW